MIQTDPKSKDHILRDTWEIRENTNSQQKLKEAPNRISLGAYRL